MIGFAGVLGKSKGLISGRIFFSTRWRVAPHDIKRKKMLIHSTHS